MGHDSFDSSALAKSRFSGGGSANELSFRNRDLEFPRRQSTSLRRVGYQSVSFQGQATKLPNASRRTVVASP